MEQDNKVVKAGIGYTIGNYMLKGLVFFTIPIFSRLMNTSDYGVYSTFISYEGIMFVIIGIALNSSYRSAWYRYGVEEKKQNYYSYVSTTMVVIGISALVWLGIAIIFGNKLGELLAINKISIILLVIYSSAMAVLACFNAHIGLQYEYKKFIAISSLNAIGNVVLSILFLVTIFSGRRDVGRMLGTTIPATLVAIFIIVSFFRKARPVFDKDFLSWGLKYSIPIIPYGIGLVLLGTFDRIMINKMVGPSAAGIYSFAYNIFALVNVTAISLDNVWSPWLFERMNKKEYSIIRKQGAKYILLMMIFSGCVVLVGPELVKILGERSYWDARYCVTPIVAGGYFSFLCTLPISVEYFYEKTKIIAAGTTIAGLVNIALNYFFIGRYGYIAAAYTTLVTYFLYFIVHYFAIPRIHGSKLFSDKYFLICGLSILGLTVFSNIFINSVIIRWAVAIVLGLSFIVIEEKEFKFAKRILGRFAK